MTAITTNDEIIERRGTDERESETSETPERTQLRVQRNWRTRSRITISEEDGTDDRSNNPVEEELFSCLYRHGSLSGPYCDPHGQNGYVVLRLQVRVRSYLSAELTTRERA
eukprot:GHVQ01036771.1.p1 GENE.GHVQ01036771.1~~GHVQ01036771.1.p1  ORF type:complete len:111 (-),score=12.39 GHVQ01036771.1:293-625(-)